MNLRTVMGILVACVSGFLGGTVASRGRAEASAGDVIRASRFELVNPAGTTVAAWEVTPTDEIDLRFTSARGAALEIGADTDGWPFLRMRGQDHGNRIVMKLDTRGKPVLAMSDEKWEGRVRLGFIEPDMLDPSSDDWGLFFCPFGTTRPIVGMTMMKTTSGQMEGRLLVSGRSIR